MKLYFAAVLALASSTIAYAQQPSFLAEMEASAASCSITGSTESTSAFIAGRDYGQTSKKYQAAVSQAFQKTKACVEGEKPKIKSKLKPAIEAQPEMRPQLVDAYAKWISYMDWLSTPRDFLDESPEQSAFEQAANRLRAEMDAQ